MDRFDDMGLDELNAELKELRQEEDNDPDQGTCSVCGCNDFYLQVDVESEWEIDRVGEIIRLREDVDEPCPEDMAYWYCTQCNEDAIVSVGDAANFVELKIQELKEELIKQELLIKEEERKEKRHKEELRKQEQEEIEKEKEYQLNQTISNILVAMMPQIREQVLKALKEVE